MSVHEAITYLRSNYGSVVSSLDGTTTFKLHQGRDKIQIESDRGPIRVYPLDAFRQIYWTYKFIEGEGNNSEHRSEVLRVREAWAKFNEKRKAV